jgi:hypothetical protein
VPYPDAMPPQSKLFLFYYKKRDHGLWPAHSLQAAVQELDLFTDHHLAWMEKLFQLSCMNNIVYGTSADRAGRPWRAADKDGAHTALLEHAAAAPGGPVDPSTVQLVKDGWTLSSSAASKLAYHRCVAVPAVNSAASYIKACWRGYRVRRALMDPALPHNRKRILEELCVINSDLKKVKQ